MLCFYRFSYLICSYIITKYMDDVRLSHLNKDYLLTYLLIASQLRHASTIRNKLDKQQYLLHMFTSLGHPCKF